MMNCSFIENYFAWNRELAEKGYAFEAYIHKQDQITVETRKYIDISYVNYWTDRQEKRIYKVHMRNGEVLDVDNAKFDEEYCPHGVNVINEVTKEEYL